MGVKALQRTALGQEATAGTAVAATAMWRGPAGNMQDDRPIEFADEATRYPINLLRSYSPRLGATLSMPATEATYNQLPYILEAGIVKETAAADGGGTAYIYDYQMPTTALRTIRTFTIETGDDSQAYEMEYSFVESFTLSGNAEEALMMSAEWRGRQVSKVSFTGVNAVAVEEILGGNGTISIDATSGNYGDTAVTAGSVLSFSLDVTTGQRAKYTIDNSQLYFHSTYFDSDSFDATCTIVYEHSTAGIAEYDAFVAQTPRLFRLLFDGDALGGAGAYSLSTLEVDFPGVYESFGVVDEQDGNSIVEAVVRIGYDLTDASGLRLAIIADIGASLT